MDVEIGNATPRCLLAVRGTCSEVEVDIKQGLIVALLLRLCSADDDVVGGGRSEATTPGWMELNELTSLSPRRYFAAWNGGSPNKIGDEVRSGCRCSDYSYCGRVALKIIQLGHPWRVRHSSERISIRLGPVGNRDQYSRLLIKGDNQGNLLDKGFPNPCFAKNQDLTGKNKKIGETL